MTHASHGILGAVLIYYAVLIQSSAVLNIYHRVHRKHQQRQKAQLYGSSIDVPGLSEAVFNFTISYISVSFVPLFPRDNTVNITSRSVLNGRIQARCAGGTRCSQTRTRTPHTAEYVCNRIYILLYLVYYSSTLPLKGRSHIPGYGVWLDWGWLGCFGLCGVDEIEQFILLIVQDINLFSPWRHDMVRIYVVGKSYPNMPRTGYERTTNNRHANREYKNYEQ